MSTGNVDKVIDEMNTKGIDILVLVNPSNIKYVSGFDMPFASGWMGDVSDGLPMVTAVISAKMKTCRLVASDLYKNKIVRSKICDAEIFRSFTHTEINLNYS